MIAVVDLGLNNVRSVLVALDRVGAPARVAPHAHALDGADAIILPGVGAFEDGMAALRERGLVEPIVRLARDERRPLLGICLGMHLLADVGEEHGEWPGLGLIPGRVVRLPGGAGRRVPNLGWHDVEPRAAEGDRPGDRRGCFYFAHSFVMHCAETEDVAATFDCGGRWPAIVRRGAVAGVQFHPEKSQDDGLDLLRRFADQALGAPA